MKKSEVIILTLVAGTALAVLNLERQPETVRDVYNSREECQWDHDDTQCRDGSGGRGSSSSGRWYGPDYRDDEGARRGPHATGQETVRRGGFGFSGRGASS